MPQPLTVEEQRRSHRDGSPRSLLGWWPLATGLALAGFSLATDDPSSIEGGLLVLMIATCAYALIALIGRRSWSWPLTGLVAVVYLAGDALSLSGPIVLVGITLAAVIGGIAFGRWRPPPAEMRWQPRAALAFQSSAVTALTLDLTAANVVIGLGLLLHGAWDIVHWRRRVVVSRSLSEWCAALDITLGLGILALVLVTT